jgi:endonuclease/exonuclease/phosphatase family metal-dependent hydrolase
MKLKSYLYITAILFISGIISACKYDTTIANPDDYVKIYMSQAAESPASRTFIMADTLNTIIFGASYGGPANLEQDVQVSFKASPELVAGYNQANETSYAVLPADSYTFEGTAGVIKMGQTSTAPLKIKIKTKGVLQQFKQYLLPVSIAEVSGNKPVNEALKTTFFRVEAQREGMSFKVLSVGKGGTALDMNAVANIVNAQGPDIVLVREMDIKTTRSNGMDQAEVLAGLIGMPNYVFAPSIVAYQGGQYGATVFSKYPIVKQETFILPTGNTNVEKGPLAVVELQVNASQRITFAGTHLNATVGVRDVQLAELIRITENYKDKPMILAGNFNDRPVNGPLYLTMAGKNWEYPCATCPANTPIATPVNYSDFIMYRTSQDFKVLAHIVGTASTSAHLPVITQFTLYK